MLTHVWKKQNYSSPTGHNAVMWLGGILKHRFHAPVWKLQLPDSRLSGWGPTPCAGLPRKPRRPLKYFEAPRHSRSMVLRQDVMSFSAQLMPTVWVNNSNNSERTCSIVAVKLRHKSFSPGLPSTSHLSMFVRHHLAPTACLKQSQDQWKCFNLKKNNKNLHEFISFTCTHW